MNKILLISLFFILIAISMLIYKYYPKTITQINQTKAKTYTVNEMIRFTPDQEISTYFTKRDYHCYDDIQVQETNCIKKTLNGFKNICQTNEFTTLRC